MAERPANPGSAAWQPALDGLRGVAVLAVLLYHHVPGAVPGGFLGVSLFFTLSGYLITTLLLREHDATGTVSLRRFWGRRARRLVPVALCGLALAAAVAWWTAPTSVGAVGIDIRFAAFHLANWHQIDAGVTYGALTGAPSPVTHFWSLAVEEQFYLLYPVVALVALRRGRGALALALAGLTAASIAAQLLDPSPARAYLATHTRLAELTIGAALALAVAHRRPARRWAADLTGGAALLALLAAWATVTVSSPGLLRGGLAVHAVGAALVITAAVHGHLVPRALSARPLVSLGLVSYGVYVVHLPLYLVLTPERTSLDGPALLATRLVGSVAVAIGLHWLVERPVRWGGALPGWEGRLGWLTATAAVLIVAVAIPHVPRDAPRTVTLATGGDTTTVVLMDTPRLPDPDDPAPAPSTPTAEPSSPDTSVGSAVEPTAPVTTEAPAPLPTAAPSRALRLLVVGDSTAAVTGQGLQQWAEESRVAAVDVVAGPACAFEQTGTVIFRSGWEQSALPACTELLANVEQVAREHPPDAVVVLIGSMQIADWRAPADTARSIGDPVFDARYRASAEGALARLESLGAPVLWATVPVPSWDPTVAWPGGSIPGSGPLTMNDAGRAHRLNELNAQVARDHPLVRLVAFAELISAPDGSVSGDLRPDGLHLRPQAVPNLMGDGLEALLRDGYHAVARARPDAVEPGTTIWSG